MTDRGQQSRQAPPLRQPPPPPPPAKKELTVHIDAAGLDAVKALIEARIAELVDQRNRAVRALAAVVSDMRVGQAAVDLLDEPWAQEVLQGD